MESVNCPHCSTQLVADARFCPACGKATAPTESGSSWPAAAGAVPDLVGREIAGRYRIVSKLGEGGMGAVYRAEQISLKRAVAVKVLRPELSSNQMILRRFNAEAEAVAKLSHPNTVNIYDFGQDTDGSLFIAMEFIEGRSLRSAIQNEGPFPPSRAIAIALQVAASLSDAHESKIVHRDLKPDNVMLQDRGRQRDIVRVLDFGIAKLRDDSRQTQNAMTQAGDMLGTPQYMAPEQIKGEAIDGRTDIYALGCMIYEMVTARLPYEAPTIMAMLTKHLMDNPVPPTQRRPELGLPPSIDQIVLAAMAKEANARPATMDQFSEMLAALLPTLPADPNRPAPSMQQPVVGAAATAISGYQQPTPAGMSGFQPPGFQPPTPAPFAPPAPPPGFLPPPGHLPAPIAPTAAISAAAGMVAKSRAPVWIALGVLGLGGAGVGVWAATRDSNSGGKATAGSGSSEQQHADSDEADEAADKPDPPDDPTPVTGDPWAEPDGAPADGTTTLRKPHVAEPAPARPKSVGTAETPIPKGASITPPHGFVKMAVDAKSVAYADSSRGLVVAMAPLFAGTNDPTKLAAMWTKTTGAKLIGQDKVQSAGAVRPGLAFTAAVNNVPVAQVIVLYITDQYRLAVIYQAPAASLTDEDLQHEIDAFFSNNVHMP